MRRRAGTCRASRAASAPRRCARRTSSTRTRRTVGSRPLLRRVEHGPEPRAEDPLRVARALARPDARHVARDRLELALRGEALAARLGEGARVVELDAADGLAGVLGLVVARDPRVRAALAGRRVEP